MQGARENPSVHRKMKHSLTTLSSSKYRPGLLRGGEVRGGPAVRVPGVPHHGLHAEALRPPGPGGQVSARGV